MRAGMSCAPSASTSILKYSCGCQSDNIQEKKLILFELEPVLVFLIFVARTKWFSYQTHTMQCIAFCCMLLVMICQVYQILKPNKKRIGYGNLQPLMREQCRLRKYLSLWPYNLLKCRSFFWNFLQSPCSLISNRLPVSRIYVLLTVIYEKVLVIASRHWQSALLLPIISAQADSHSLLSCPLHLDFFRFLFNSSSHTDTALLKPWQL